MSRDSTGNPPARNLILHYLARFKHALPPRVKSFVPNRLIFSLLQRQQNRIAELSPLFEGEGNAWGLDTPANATGSSEPFNLAFRVPFVTEYGALGNGPQTGCRRNRLRPKDPVPCRKSPWGTILPAAGFQPALEFLHFRLH